MRIENRCDQHPTLYQEFGIWEKTVHISTQSKMLGRFSPGMGSSAGETIGVAKGLVERRMGSLHLVQGAR